MSLEGVHLRPINQIANNLVYGAHASDVETVLVDGRIVVENGRLCSLDRDMAIDGAEAYALRRFRQAGLEISPYHDHAAVGQPR